MIEEARPDPFLKRAAGVPIHGFWLVARDTWKTKEPWIGPAAAIVAAQLIFALVITQSLNHRSGPPIFGYIFIFVQILAVTVPSVLFYHVLRLRGAPSPARRLAEKAAGNCDLLFPVLAGLLLAISQLAALTWIKPALPMLAGFWADPFLANLEGALFSTDPWKLAHWIAGSRNMAVDWIYGLWFPAVLSVLLFVLASRQAAKSQVIVAFYLTVFLCVALQFALPSGGPIFFERLGFGDRYAEMIPRLPNIAQTGASYLWKYHSTQQGGTAIGISAMPSVHVALAFWVAIAARDLRRRLFRLALVWYCLIFFGSVYLGWHYVLDGVAGTAIAVAAYRLSFLKLAPGARGSGITIVRPE